MSLPERLSGRGVTETGGRCFSRGRFRQERSQRAGRRAIKLMGLGRADVIWHFACSCPGVLLPLPGRFRTMTPVLHMVTETFNRPGGWKSTATRSCWVPALQPLPGENVRTMVMGLGQVGGQSSHSLDGVGCRGQHWAQDGHCH